MRKIRLIVGIRKGLYDPETDMYSLPTCFDNQQSAQRALQSLAKELGDFSDIQLVAAQQLMVSVRPETYERYDEAGEFPRLYKARKDEFQGYVIHIDLPDTDELKRTVRATVAAHGLQVIDEGPATAKTLLFIA
jgi:hypothetical protein